MEAFLVVMLAINMAMASPSYAQMRTPCGASSMFTSFTPCFSFLMNSNPNPNDSIPTTQCCKSLRTLASGSMECLCLFVNGDIPFTLAINKTLASYLPQACDIPSVLLQCQISAPKLPAPGPVSLGLSPPALSGFTPSPSPKASSSGFPSRITPQTVTPSSSSSSSSVDSNTPSVTASEGHSQITPSSSSAMPSYSLSPSFLLIPFAFAVLKYY